MSSSADGQGQLIVSQNQLMTLTGGTALQPAKKPIYARLMYDGSSSIRDNKPCLVEPLKGAARDFEIGLSNDERNLMSRAIFHQRRIELEGGNFLRPADWMAAPMADR